MATKSSNILWTVALIVLVLLALAAALLGPRLYREGRALVGPIAELAGAEKAMAALDQDFPFEPPETGIVREERLASFFDVWDELRGRYTEWQELVSELEGRRAQSWQEAKEALAATRDVHRAQREILRAHGMSPTELVWIEDAALSWWRQIEPELSEADRPAVVRALREARESDRRLLRDLEGRHGPSPALKAVERHLEAELASLDPEAMPETADVPLENQRLFWRHRERIASIAAATRNPLHEMIREPGGVRLELEEEGRPLFLEPE